MSSPTVKIDVSGARGESFADIARRTGVYGVLPGDSDAAALAKFNAAADAAAATAQLAEAGALVAGNIYDSTAAGLAGTPANGYFTVVGTGDTFATLYQDVAGSAVSKGQYPSKSALDAKANLSALISSTGLNLLGSGTGVVAGFAAPSTDVPQGNPYATTKTKFSAKLLGTDAALTGVRGFTFMAGVDNGGSAGTDNVDDLVAGYFGATGTAYSSGSSGTVRKPIWAINTLTELKAGSGTYNARGIETDFNNFLRNIGAGDGAAYTSEVIACGIEVFHSGSFGSTAGVMVNVGSDGSVPYYRGFAVAPEAASQAGFADYSDSAYSYDSRGSHAYGLHLVGNNSFNVINGPLNVGSADDPEAGIELDVHGDTKVRGFLNVVGATNLDGSLGVKLDGTLKAVSLGAADSGGAGYKVLRVAN